jgi:outer membrane protein TolC
MATARAVLTRTEWEIAAQELIVSIATARAFDTVLYRQRKLEVLEDTIKFNEQVVERVKALADLGRLRPADLILARTELDTARAALGQGKTALAQARAALRQQFGTLDDSFAVRGELDLPVPTTEFDVYAQVALEQRPDVQVRRAAAEEARARARLQRADRFGNPSVGPFFELNETNVAFVGAALFAPIPVLNTRRGEIMQAEALAARAQAEVRQFEIQSAQDVQAALARLTEARKWVESYTGTVLPNLRKAVEDTNKLFEQNDPGADVLRVIGVQRNYLRALDASYDALFELSQARADLAAAVGDPNLALGRYPAPAKGK